MDKVPGFETTITAEPTQACGFWNEYAEMSVATWGPAVLEGGIYNVHCLAASMCEIATDIVWDDTSWWYWDPIFSGYLQTSERRVEGLYRRIVIFAGQESGTRSVKSVTYPLVGLANRVIEVARDLLRVDEDFWQRNPRIVKGRREGITSVESVGLFIGRRVEKNLNSTLTLHEAYEYYVAYCEGERTIPLKKGRFAEEMAQQMRPRFGVRLRNDIPVTTKGAESITRGWKGVGMKNVS